MSRREGTLFSAPRQRCFPGKSTHVSQRDAFEREAGGTNPLYPRKTTTALGRLIVLVLMGQAAVPLTLVVEGPWTGRRPMQHCAGRVDDPCWSGPALRSCSTAPRDQATARAIGIRPRLDQVSPQRVTWSSGEGRKGQSQ